MKLKYSVQAIKSARSNIKTAYICRDVIFSSNEFTLKLRDNFIAES